MDTLFVFCGGAVWKMSQSPNNDRKRLVVIVGPSGAGKTTLVDKLRAQYPSLFSRCVNHTTREPRANEQNGVDYHFVSHATMLAEITRGNFVEWANVHENIYGVSKAALTEAAVSGIPLLIVDVQGARSIGAVPELDPLFVFLTTPSLAELEKRLRARGTDTDAVIEQRLKNAVRELAAFADMPQWNLLVNNKLEECYTHLQQLLVSERILPHTKDSTHSP